MGSQPDPLRKRFAPLQAKNLKNALSHRIRQQFPRIGGDRIGQLCAEMVLEVVQAHLRGKEHLTHGQVLWLAVALDDPPRRHQTMAETDLVPVVLDLSTPADVEQRLQRVSPAEHLLSKALRLCQQAYRQGGLLSNCDLAELLATRDELISQRLCQYERQHRTIVPRRATLHDVGSGVTHKRIICYKRYAEGKPAELVARETYHSLEAVDRYLGQYDRVRHCRQQRLSPQQTAHILDCSLRLVQQYLAIDDELEAARA
jgi:hypothetical protein